MQITNRNISVNLLLCAPLQARSHWSWVGCLSYCVYIKLIAGSVACKVILIHGDSSHHAHLHRRVKVSSSRILEVTCMLVHACLLLKLTTTNLRAYRYEQRYALCDWSKVAAPTKIGFVFLIYAEQPTKVIVRKSSRPCGHWLKLCVCARACNVFTLKQQRI